VKNRQLAIGAEKRKPDDDGQHREHQPSLVREIADKVHDFIAKFFGPMSTMVDGFCDHGWLSFSWQRYPRLAYLEVYGVASSKGVSGEILNLRQDRESSQNGYSFCDIPGGIRRD
jgi:hypothetical protein